MAKDKKKAPAVEAPADCCVDEMERQLPSFSVDAKDLPMIKNWKVGEKCKIELEVEVTELGKRQWGKDKDELYARLSVKDFIDPSKEDSEEEAKVEKKVDGAYIASKD